jgi:hypothetical protein
LGSYLLLLCLFSLLAPIEDNGTQQGQAKYNWCWK